MSELLRAVNIAKVYQSSSKELAVLNGLDFNLQEKEAACIVGASGAGKSTLLHIMGTLDYPTSGEVYYRGESLFLKSDDELARFRAEKLGFVFQFHHLMSELTAVENVALAAQINGASPTQAREKATYYLDRLGLIDRLSHFPSQLSGGEQQRVAIARALVNGPEILFADEPTGTLDSRNARIIQDLFFQLREDLGLTLIVVTHDAKVASLFSRPYNLVDGHWS